MNNAQRFVFSGLVLTLALEFGSFTKFKKIWDLAFTGGQAPPPASTNNTPGQSGTPSGPPINLVPGIHPPTVVT